LEGELASGHHTGEGIKELGHFGTSSDRSSYGMNIPSADGAQGSAMASLPMIATKPRDATQEAGSPHLASLASGPDLGLEPDFDMSSVAEGLGVGLAAAAEGNGLASCPELVAAAIGLPFCGCPDANGCRAFPLIGGSSRPRSQARRFSTASRLMFLKKASM
jgi:hypothetical protein